MKRVIFFISALLLATSGYMYVSMDHSSQTQLQSSSIKFSDREKKAKNVKRNPYVIWFGSNEMPPGMNNGKVLKPATTPKDEPSGQPQAQPQPQTSGGGITPEPAQQENAPAVVPGQATGDSGAGGNTTGGGITPGVINGGDDAGESGDSAELNPGDGGGNQTLP